MRRAAQSPPGFKFLTFIPLQPPRPLVSSSSSVHVSFLSPVESEVPLPSFSSSSEETFPLPNHSTSNMLASSPCMMNTSPSLHQSHVSPTLMRSKPLHSVPKSDAKRDDKTLKLLQQHYMNAILSLTPDRKQVKIYYSQYR